MTSLLASLLGQARIYMVQTALCQTLPVSSPTCVAGIVTSLLASLLGQARIYVVLGRAVSKPICVKPYMCAGIVTSLLASLLGQARIYVVLGREGLLPPGLAQLHPRRATPVRATWLTGASAGMPATGGWTITGPVGPLGIRLRLMRMPCTTCGRAHSLAKWV